MNRNSVTSDGFQPKMSFVLKRSKRLRSSRLLDESPGENSKQQICASAKDMECYKTKDMEK